MSPRNNRSSDRTAKANIIRRANLNGVYAVRRKISPASLSLMQSIEVKLLPELHNVGRLFDAHMLGVTVIGFSRFDKRHRGIGPSTASISEKITSTKMPLEVVLGRLAVYGSELKAKLGIDIFSDELINEELEYESCFSAADFPLKDDYNSNGSYKPHVSLALMYGDNFGYFKDKKLLARLDSVAGLGANCDKRITLEPVRPPEVQIYR